MLSHVNFRDQGLCMIVLETRPQSPLFPCFKFFFSSCNELFIVFLFHLPLCKELLIIFLSFCSNPDQSKHLETARMRLFDIWIDFVNLRSEEYAENSRIPSKVYNCSVFWLCTSFTYSAVLTNLHGIFFFVFL